MSTSSDPKQLTLVNSKRLSTLIKQGRPSQNAQQSIAVQPESGLSSLIQQEIDRLLRGLPANMKHNLFKIRYGYSPDELLAMPPQQAATILKLKPRLR